jgi:O-antigen/teichoic acid export membrane protein
MSLLMTAGAIAEGLMDAYLKAREKISRQVLFILLRTLVEITAVLFIFGTQDITQRSVVEMLSLYILYVFVAKLLIYPTLIIFRSTHEIDWPLKPERRAFVHYGMPMVPTVLVSWLVAQGDRLLLGHMVDKHALGIYAFGASMAAYVTYIGYAVYPLLLPRASRLFDQGRFDELRAMFRQSQLVFLMICSTALAFIGLFAGEIISLTAGENFAQSATIFFVLSLAVGVEQMAGIYQYVFHLVKKPRLILYFNLIYGVLAASFVYAAAKIGGVAYVPWGILAAVILLNVARYLMAQREFSISIRIEHLAGLFISLVLVILLQHYLSTLPLVIKMVVMGVLTLALGSTLLRQFGKSEVNAAELS